jgi:putative transposase
MTIYHRHLPHWQPEGRDLFLAWRLQNSLPENFHPPKNLETSGKVFVAYDRVLDQAQTGPRWLKDPRIAKCVLDALAAAQQDKLLMLRCYVLMTNHVHVLISPQAPLAKITQKIKGSSARMANLILGRTGTRFWQDESYDHWVRDLAEFERIRLYIERNPVVAGLVKRPEDWPWSSARRTGF